MQLSSSNRKYLKGLAHHLEPIVRIGRDGLSSGLIATLNTELEIHELVKVKFVDQKPERNTLAKELEGQTNSDLIEVLGMTAVFYRQHSDPEKRKIKLPKK